MLSPHVEDGILKGLDLLISLSETSGKSFSIGDKPFKQVALLIFEVAVFCAVVDDSLDAIDFASNDFFV
jgi:hypothetical protein